MSCPVCEVCLRRASHRPLCPTASDNSEQTVFGGFLRWSQEIFFTQRVFATFVMYIHVLHWQVSFTGNSFDTVSKDEKITAQASSDILSSCSHYFNVSANQTWGYVLAVTFTHHIPLPAGSLAQVPNLVWGTVHGRRQFLHSQPSWMLYCNSWLLLWHPLD